MFLILAIYGIPDAIINAIRCVYINSESFISTHDGDTEAFAINTGVLLGDTLAEHVSRVENGAERTKTWVERSATLHSGNREGSRLNLPLQRPLQWMFCCIVFIALKLTGPIQTLECHS